MPNPLKPLIKKTYKGLRRYQERVLNFNPKEVYKRITIDPYKRQQGIKIASMFPQSDKKLCSCGCGRKLKGKQRRWATEDCQKFAYHVNFIINGDTTCIKRYLEIYFGQWACKGCGTMNIYQEYKNGMIVDGIHIDHILAVTNGGGGCWLSNYQLLCVTCHKEKTRKDVRKSENKKRNIKGSSRIRVQSKRKRTTTRKGT